MATSIYLGNPPENIKKWIIDNYKEPWPEYTKCIYADNSYKIIDCSLYNISPEDDFTGSGGL
jgi:hypothetical protein